jgi:predicted DNA-binding transcriptional regulator YafY
MEQMNRIYRMTAILLFLQGRKRTTREIAERFETSKRTILRDVQALCEMGIPIESSTGVTGGYTLLPDYSLPPLALTLQEAILLRLALGSLSQLGDPPFKEERESLLTKVQTLLPRHDRLVIDGFEQTVSFTLPSQPYPTPFLKQLLESAHVQQWLTVTYRSEKGLSQQTILPTHLRTTAGLWYCEAYSHERQGNRVYRVDRFLEVCIVRTSDQLTYEVPPDLQVHPSFVEVQIELTARGVLILESNLCLGPHIQKVEEGGGWLSMHFQQQDYEWLVRVVLSLGVEAKVVAPEDLQQRVWQEAQAIACHHKKQ